MRTKLILTASAIALAAGVGSASADEMSGTAGGFPAFHALEGIQAIPLGSDEMASITAAHWLKVDRKSWKVSELNGHLEHYTHGGVDAHGIKYVGGGAPEYDDYYAQKQEWFVDGSYELHEYNP